MTFATANPRQPFYVLNQIELFPRDEKILIQLYQPLMGATAVALYQTLIQNFKAYAILKDAHGIYLLQEQLDCSLRELFTALHKLEAVGLVRTFLTQSVIGQVLAFRLLRVPTAQQFFATPLLASLLKQKVGVTTFHALSHHFAKIARLENKKLQDAKEVSATFPEVFHLAAGEAINPSPDVQEAAQENAVQHGQRAQLNVPNKVDWQLMADEFARYQIPVKEIKLNRPRIAAVMQSYGLDEHEFVAAVLPTLHGSYHLHMNAIEKSIADNYKSLQTRQQLQKQLNLQRQKKPAVATVLEPNRKKLLEQAEELSPAEFLYKLKRQKGGFASGSEKEILNNLHDRYGLSTSLVNLLAYTCLSYDAVVTTRLAYSIANDWLEHGVGTAQQALTYLKQRQRRLAQRKAHGYRPIKRVEKGTDWNKKRAKVDPNIDPRKLKQFFKKLEEKNGMQ